MSSNVTLEEITGHNFEAFMEMELPDHQRDFIASNAFSIAQAKFYADYIPVSYTHLTLPTICSV